MNLRSLVLGLCLLSLIPVNRAAAFHTDRVRTISGNAFVLRKNEWEVGPFRANFGALEQLQIGTYFLPLLFLAPNLEAKLLLFQNERFSVSVRPSAFYADLSLAHKLYGIGASGTDIKLWIIPVEGYVSAIIRSRFTLTASFVYTAVRGSGSYNPEDFKGTAAAANMQAGLSFEWRVNRVTALILQTRLLVVQEIGGVGTVNLDLDDATNASITARGAPIFADVEQGFSVALSALFSFTSFNLRVGMGYGNYNVPGLNLIIPERHPFPVFDLFWRL